MNNWVVVISGIILAIIFGSMLIIETTDELFIRRARQGELGVRIVKKRNARHTPSITVREGKEALYPLLASGRYWLWRRSIIER